MVAMAITASHAPSPDDPQLLAQRETLRQLRAQFEALPEGGSAAPAGGGWAGQPGGASGAFAPTHSIPADGLQAWASPDPRTTPVPLAPGLPVIVAERVGDWARVVAANGWSGWVDGRRLP